MAAAEVAPFSKTGGLADVSGALPKALEELGVDCRVIVPYYEVTQKGGFDISSNGEPVSIKAGDQTFEVNFRKGVLPGSNVEMIFVQNNDLFGREGIYAHPSSGEGYEDFDIRFIVYQKAILEYIRRSEWKPDVLHLNDNHTALIPAYLDKTDTDLNGIATALTIHNLGYQGIFPKESILSTGFDESLFEPMSPFEFYGKLNFMKIGILHTDVISTVSKKYAEEITTEEYGEKLEGILTERTDDLYGILNGIDVTEWSPGVDKLIPNQFTIDDLSGKAENKRILLEESGLDGEKLDVPLIGVVSRLADQKGFDLIEDIIDQLMQNEVYFVLLGTGETKYHTLFEGLKVRYPDKMGIHLKFNNRMAHLIEAGADMFLMPSKYEPCGLNQMYSLGYGTIPIVRATGGLADTVDEYNPETNSGNGFVFEEYSSTALYGAIELALETFKDKEAWQQIVLRGMNQDFSWNASAKKYVELYEKAIAKNSA